MPETIKETQLFRFDQMAVQVKDKVEPEEADVDRYVGLEHIDPESLKIRRWGEPSDVESSKILFRSGDVIFGKRRAYQRKLAVADFDGICSAHAMVLRPKTDVALEQFLPFFMQSDIFMDRAVKISVGGLSPTINWRDLAKEEFALPPLEEQRRIAEVLQASEAKKVSLGKLRDHAWKTNVANYKDVTEHSDSEWGVKTIKSAIQIENRLRKPLSAKVRSDMQGDYPYYGATGQLDSIDEYRLDGKYALIGEDGDHFLKYSNQSMTQLISGQFNVNNHAHVIAGTAQCSTEWFYHYYRYRDVRQWLTKQGSGRLKLKKATLEKMPIAMPPMKEQSKLVSRLESTADAVVAIEKRIESCRSLQKQLIVDLLQLADEKE